MLNKILRYLTDGRYSFLDSVVCATGAIFVYEHQFLEAGIGILIYAVLHTVLKYFANKED